jgi:cytochrome c oxidase assembly protein subunit 15
MPRNLDELRDKITPERFRIAAWVGLIAFTVIVFTGAAVRLTDSGLGCATWPRCADGQITPPDQLHALIEFSNRSLSGLVGVVTVVVMAMAFLRRPFRRDLAVLATLLPLGVVAQAVLGGFTVREHLAPGFVMAHFSLSMIILIPAVLLVWRCYHPARSRAATSSRGLVWTVRVTVLLGALTLFAGTVATAAGPHSGGHIGQHIRRLTIKGPDTLVWAIHQHATVAVLFGFATILAWMLKRRQYGALEPTEPLTVLGILIAAQGLLGSVQYELHLPSQMVWLHVCLASVTWVVALWAWVETGSPAARRATVEAAAPEGGVAPAPELEIARV